MKEEEKISFSKRMDAEREAEYSAHNKLFTRYIPLLLTSILAIYKYEGVDVIKIIGLAYAFLILIETAYLLFESDHWLVSIFTWVIWAWFAYLIYQGSFNEIWLEIKTSFALLLFAILILAYISAYKIFKNKK